MLAYILKRLVWAVFLFFAVTLVTFTIFFVLPAAPIRAGGLGTNQDASIRDAFPFEGPLYEEYGEFVKGIVVDQSLGRSLSNRRPIAVTIRDRAPVTAAVVLGGLAMMLMIAIPVGILSALRPRSLLDRTSMGLVIVGVSLHPVWLGLILAYFLGFRWKIFPVGQYCEIFDPATACGGPVQWTYHLILPWFTFALLFAAIYTRMIRATVIESLREDYVRTARAKGATEASVLRHHVLQNAALPVVTMLGMDALPLAFSNIIFVEQVFGLPGLGGMMLEGLRRRDPPLVLGVVVTVALAIVVVNLLIDILHGTLDPRIRAATQQSRRVRGRGADAPAAPARATTA